MQVKLIAIQNVFVGLLKIPFVYLYSHLFIHLFICSLPIHSIISLFFALRLAFPVWPPQGTINCLQVLQRKHEHLFIFYIIIFYIILPH